MNAPGLAALLRSAALLVDFDGVLVDSEPAWHAAWSAVLARHGHAVPAEDYAVRWVNLGLGPEGERARGVRLPSLRTEVHRELAHRIAAAPLHREVLAAVLALARVHPVAIASNSDRALIERLLGTPLPPVVGRPPGCRPKPAPDIYLAAARRLGVPPGACVAVEDTWKGLQAARRAGMAVLVVRTPQNVAFAFPEATAILPGPAALASLLEGASKALSAARTPGGRPPPGPATTG